MKRCLKRLLIWPCIMAGPLCEDMLLHLKNSYVNVFCIKLILNWIDIVVWLDRDLDLTLLRYSGDKFQSCQTAIYRANLLFITSFYSLILFYCTSNLFFSPNLFQDCIQPFGHEMLSWVWLMLPVSHTSQPAGTNSCCLVNRDAWVLVGCPEVLVRKSVVSNK